MTLPQYIVAANRLNLRAAPSTDAKVLAVCNKGDIVLKAAQADTLDWWELVFGGLHGYAARRFLLPLSGSVPVVAGANDVLWRLTREAAGRVRYLLGNKDSRTGAIDCSGWVGEITSKAFDDVNRRAGEVVFDRDDYRVFATHSDGIVCGVEARTGTIYIGPQVTQTVLHAGMLIGVDFGQTSFEANQPPRHYGIDHIVQVVGDPSGQTLYITQSSSSGGGVNTKPLAEWLAGVEKQGLLAAKRVFAVDPFAMADTNTAFMSGHAPASVPPTGAVAPDGPDLDADVEVEIRPPVPEEHGTLTLTFEKDGILYYAKPGGGERFFIGSSTGYTDDMERVGLQQGSKGRGWITTSGIYDRHALAENPTIGKWAHFVWPTVMAESAGLHGRVNTYDRAAFTFGLMQFAAHTPAKNLIKVFQRLLALPSAAYYFPELSLRAVDGQQRVHVQKLDGSWVNLELARTVKRPNGKEEIQLADFMAYLNPDANEVGPNELKAAARLMLWCAREEDARLAQVLEAVATVKGNLKWALTKMPEFHPDKDWEKALWVGDILHQGRGGFATIRQALGSAEALSNVGTGDYKERKATVGTCIRQLKDDRSLDTWTTGLEVLEHA